MTMNIPDLIPKLAVECVVTPLAILLRQAYYLRKKYPALEALVESEQHPSDPTKLTHAFVVQVPALGNYRLLLLTIETGLAPWPAQITGQAASLPSRVEFEAALKAELASDRIVSQLTALLTQVGD